MSKPERAEHLSQMRSLGLPPIDEFFQVLDGSEARDTSQSFVHDLLVRVWEAEKCDDLAPLCEWITTWYYDQRFESERHLSETLESLDEKANIELTASDLRAHLGLP